MPVKINSAYSGLWKSPTHKISLSFNENIWTIVDQTDAEQETFVALQDVKGGSSFALRVEYAANISNLDSSQIEQALFATLESTDPELTATTRRQLVINNHNFHAVDYQLNNKLYGLQTVRHAYILSGDYALLLLMAWPQSTKQENSSCFPAKYLAFLGGLNLEQYEPLK